MCVVTGQRRDPGPRSSTTDACAYRWCASCRTAWAAPAICPPCAATYTMALSTCRLSSVTLPRGVAKYGSMLRYWASVISMSAVSAQQWPFVLTRPSTRTIRTG